MDAAVADAAAGVMTMWLPLLAVATAGNAACPADFPAFWRRFAGDAAFQRRHTAATLDVSWMDNDGPLPREVHGRRRMRAVHFPLELPAPADVRVTPTGKSRIMVTITKPDTDWQIRLTFRRDPPCWRLVRHADDLL
ncbi:hypothetical protein IP88_02445 [alpha proteobacterium AAP81b]|nr:hypothetical protein IP88_02445 [alpha proteobacterium AAP81b]